jgi:hypothetical protein
LDAHQRLADRRRGECPARRSRVPEVPVAITSTRPRGRAPSFSPSSRVGFGFRLRVRHPQRPDWARPAFGLLSAHAARDAAPTETTCRRRKSRVPSKAVSLRAGITLARSPGARALQDVRTSRCSNFSTRRSAGRGGPYHGSTPPPSPSWSSCPHFQSSFRSIIATGGLGSPEADAPRESPPVPSREGGGASVPGLPAAQLAVDVFRAELEPCRHTFHDHDEGGPVGLARGMERQSRDLLPPPPGMERGTRSFTPGRPL